MGQRNASSLERHFVVERSFVEGILSESVPNPSQWCRFETNSACTVEHQTLPKSNWRKPDLCVGFFEKALGSSTELLVGRHNPYENVRIE
jgi:hypothetical protein